MNGFSQLLLAIGGLQVWNVNEEGMAGGGMQGFVIHKVAQITAC